MRKLLAIFVVLLGCLTFVGQAAASAAAGYSDCCLNGCEGMAQCASAACQACAAPQPAPLDSPMTATANAETRWDATVTSFDVGQGIQPWKPPD